MPNDFTPSTMQEFPLSVAAILRHGERVYSASQCVLRARHEKGELPVEMLG